MHDTLLARLGELDPFARFDREVLRDASGEMRVLDLDDGEILVAVGETADEVYVVLEGELVATADDPDRPGEGARLATLGPGSVVGELAVLTASQRSATLRATADAQVVGVPSGTFLELLASAPDVGAELASEASVRLRRSQLVRHLEARFPDLSREAVTDLVGRVTWVTVMSGDALYRAGDPAEAGYVVVSGRLRVVTTDPGGQPEVVTEVGAGELVGEIALLDDEPRRVSVVAARDTQLARIDRGCFEGLVVAHPRAMVGIARVIVQRQRDVRDEFRRAESDSSTVTLVPVGSGEALAELGPALAERLSRYGRAVTISADELSRTLNAPRIAQAERMTPEGIRVDHWLDEMEERSRFVVLGTDPTPSAWTRRCLGRSDHVILVADAAADPSVTDAERALIAQRELPHQRVSLVLVHDPETDRPVGTRTWLEPRDVDDHHHLRRGHGGDLDRLARHIAGRAVTVVFSGGGAKGFAHLGVVRAMRELGIPIDGVAGSSMGAPLGALTAMEHPDEDLLARSIELYRKPFDYTIPIASMIGARRITRAIHAGAEGRDIEDLWLPFLCVSTNLTSSRLAVHRSGDLALAVRASLSIPGVMPPVPYGEDLLVDGGVLNNLPVDVMRRLNPTGTVIASDVAPQRGPRARIDYGLSLRGGSVLAKRMTPGVEAPRVPGLMTTLTRSLLVAAAESRDRGVRRGLADLHMEFDLRGVGLLDFSSTEPVAEMGYEQSKPVLEAWLAENAPTF